MRHMTIRKTTVIPVAIVAAIALFAAIGALSDNSATPRRGTKQSLSTRVDEAQVPKPPTTPWGTAAGSEPATAADGATAVSSDLTMSYDFASLGPDRSRSLVRNGQLALTVDKGSIPATVARVIGLTDSMGGYIVSSYMGTAGPGQPYPMEEPTGSGVVYQDTTTTPGADPYATITVRVPARNFDEAVTRLSRLGTVQQLTTSTDDVTSQMVDLRARLRHFNAVEARLLGFLAQTKTISETLRVQDRLDEAQLQIEQLEGQLNALDETVSYSMLSVSLTEKDAATAAAATSTGGFAGRFMDSVRLIAHGARVSFVALGAVLPFAVLIAVVGGVILVGRRRLHRRSDRLTPPTQQALQS